MYLKSLEIYGFKSFGEKTVIDFKDGITVVVGPNGSGKSNIVDSIRWVLGEQSIKSLRGNKSQDVIFSGTEFRKGAGFAEVVIVFENKNNMFPIEFSEIRISRRLYRTGENEYYINGAISRLKDIQDIVMGTGIGRDGYSIISQGRVDEILSGSPETRRKIFEEASGIAKYRKRKEETEKKIEKSNENLVRINDIYLEVANNFPVLEEKAKKAKKYLEYSSRLKEIEIAIFSKSLEELNASTVKFVDIKSDIENSIFDLNKENKENEKKLINIKTDIEQKNNMIILNNENFIEKEQKITNLKNDNLLKKAVIEKNIENIDSFSVEQKEIKEKLEKLDVEILEKNSKLSFYTKEKEDFQKNIFNLEKELENLVGKQKFLKEKIELLRNSVDENIEKIYENNNKVLVNETRMDSYKKEVKEKKKESVMLTLEIDRKRESYSLFTSENKELFENKAVFDNKINNINIKEKNIALNIETLSNEIQKINQELSANKAKLNLLEKIEKENSSYNYAIKKILEEVNNKTNIGNLVKDVVGNVIKTPKKYILSIETALGYAIQNIIVEKEEDAKEIISYLKDKKYGRATFLPISGIKENNIRENIVPVEGFVGIAKDLVNVDKKYEKVVSNLLGRIIITEDMNSAIAFSRKNRLNLKIVTLNGDIINSSGSMTGGSLDKNVGGILSRKENIKELINIIKKLEQNLFEKETSLKKELVKRDSILEEKNKLVHEFEKKKNEFIVFEEKRKQKEKELEDLVAKNLNLNEKLKLLEKEILDCENENSLIKLEIEKTEKENIEKEKEINNLIDNDEIRKIDDYSSQISDLKISLSSFIESEKNSLEIIQMLNNQKGDLNKSNISKDNKIKELLEKNKEFTSKIEENEKRINEIILENNSSTKEQTALVEEKKILEQNLNKLNELILENKNKLILLEKQKDKTEFELSKIEIEKENLIYNLWENYEISLKNIDEKINKNEILEISLKDGEKEIKELKLKLKEIGSVDVLSIDEFSAIKERKEFLEKQIDDINKSILHLRGIIKEMQEIMTKKFTESMEKINISFQEVFSELFGGGNAEIKMIEPLHPLDTDIEIIAQPPGKRVKTMLLLSGGERTLTAIAILFAMLKINPSPFCVLDEIEAALDDINIDRFATYLNNYSKEIQFLVITHRKGTMEVATCLYGATMEEKGITKLVSLNFEKREKFNKFLR